MTITETVLRVPDSAGSGGYQLRVAAGEAELTAAAKLRDRVYPGHTTPGPVPAVRDDFTGRSAHLVVWHTANPGSPGTVAGTDCLFPPSANRSLPRSAGLSVGSEFDVAPLEPILHTTIEASRPCIDAEHRGSAPPSAVRRRTTMTSALLIFSSCSTCSTPIPGICDSSCTTGRRDRR